MGLEVASFVASLVSTNPVSNDVRAEGDDHLRLIKAALQGSFPTSSKAWYNPSYVAKTSSYSVLSTDMNKLISFDATGGACVPTLPSLSSGDAGWSCDIIKIDVSTNAVTITPASGTINGSSTIVLSLQWQWARLIWTGTTWYVAQTAPQFVSTDPGPTSGPVLDLFRDSASPAASDAIGVIQFNGRDSAGNKQLYGRYLYQITGAVSGSEASNFFISTFIAGAEVTVLQSSGAQIQIPGSLALTGNLDINTNKFNVTASNGNTAIAGTLTVTGAASAASVTGTQVATQSDQETGSSTSTIVTPGRQQFHPSAAKYWGNVSVSGGTPTLNSSYNVSSITDTATGRLTVNINVDFSGTFYAPLVVTTANTASQRIGCVSVGTVNAGTIEYGCMTVAPAYIDPDSWFFSGYGDQ